MSGQHARFSPSAASCRIDCPPSLALEEQFEYKESQYTEYQIAGRMFMIRAVVFYIANVAIQTAYLKVGTTYILSNQVQLLNSSLADYHSAILLTGEKIYVKAGVSNDIRYRILGMEMDV